MFLITFIKILQIKYALYFKGNTVMICLIGF